MALTYTPDPELGTPCPDFQLLATNGKTYSQKDFEADVLVVMFICNHCPYVQAVEDRLIELAQSMKDQNVDFVAICSNDPNRYPDDSFEKLKERAETKGYPFPYLHDESQKVAKDFGAVCTPDFFVYNSNRLLAYRGRLDDNWKNPAEVSEHDMKRAIENLLRGQNPPEKQIPSMGCSIKWIENPS